jgi:AcrR family transcriptional regulator
VAGRPRDPRVDAAILAATLRVLADDGYTRLSIDMVAKRAGVSRPTVYLRWPSKAQLVHEAVFPDIPAGELPIPHGPDFAADVTTMLQQAISYLSRPEVLAAAPGLMAEFKTDPELRGLMAARLEDRLRTRLADRVAEAVAAGEAAAHVDAGLLLDVITGTVLFALLASPPEAPPIDIEALSAMLLLGLLPRAADVREKADVRESGWPRTAAPRRD